MKRERGRPEKPPEERRSVLLPIRLTEAERAEIDPPLMARHLRGLGDCSSRPLGESVEDSPRRGRELYLLAW